jgi:tRNA(adenine34) deaminase
MTSGNDAQDAVWMAEALEMARAAVPSGNTPVASVIVRNGVKIGVGGNQVTSQRNPILHAEIVAIEDACRRVGTAELAGATLYTTMEPCPMCAWAIHCAGIPRVVLGARNTDLGRPDVGSYSFEKLMAMGGGSIALVTGVLNAECVTLRRDWTRQTGRWV